MKKLRCFLQRHADDESTIRNGLSRLITSYHMGLEVAALAADGEEALAAFRRTSFSACGVMPAPLSATCRQRDVSSAHRRISIFPGRPAGLIP